MFIIVISSFRGPPNDQSPVFVWRMKHSAYFSTNKSWSSSTSVELASVVNCQLFNPPPPPTTTTPSPPTLIIVNLFYRFEECLFRKWEGLVSADWHVKSPRLYVIGVVTQRDTHQPLHPTAPPKKNTLMPARKTPHFLCVHGTLNETKFHDPFS